MQFEKLVRCLTSKKLIFQSSEHLSLAVRGAYSGFDPTAPSLHIGNLVPIFGLIQCSRMEIPPFALIGSATTIIGDPTGRSTAKHGLSTSEIETNSHLIQAQIQTIYERSREFFDGNPMKPLSLVNNLDWFKDVKFIDFLSDVGRCSKVSTMLSRHCVQNRLQSEDGLSFCEFSYQLMQGYDFYMLNRRFGVNVQIGGRDQWGNMVTGIDLIQKLAANSQAACLTMPLLTTASGVKMGKSGNNGIWLDSNMTSIYDFYQYFVSLSDQDALKNMFLLNLLESSWLENLVSDHNASPAEHKFQRFLAHHLVSLVHGKHMADIVQEFSGLIFSKGRLDIEFTKYGQILDEKRRRKIHQSSIRQDSTIFDFLKMVFPDISRADLRNYVKSGAIKINFQKITDLNQKVRMVALNQHLLINIGKSSFYFVTIEG